MKESFLQLHIREETDVHIKFNGFPSIWNTFSLDFEYEEIEHNLLNLI